MTTVGNAMDRARALGLDRLDTQLLLSHVVARQRTWLLAHDDTLLSDVQAAVFGAVCGRRAAGEPLAYIVGEKAFHGVRLNVDPRVLVPRPDTEVLVDWALELLAQRSPGPPAPKVVDLGTGSGAIALAVKHARPEVSVLATDLSASALDVARSNVNRLGLDLELSMHAWWHGLEGRRFDLVLSNPPYIAAGDPHLAALQHEPLGALVSGPDGMSALREIVAGAPEHLSTGGWLLLEHGHDQAVSVQSLLGCGGFVQIETRRDLGDQPRCTGARWLSAAE